MRRPVTLALRFAAVIIALGLIHLALSPAGPANSPYLSALSSLSAPAAEPGRSSEGPHVKPA